MSQELLTMKWYKIAKKQISKKEMDDIGSLAKKIMMGKREWTPLELQLQANFPELLEEILLNQIKESS